MSTFEEQSASEKIALEAKLNELTDVERQIARKGVDVLSDDPFLFAVVTGTHQYGFTSVDSDIDVRGAFIAPTESMLGIKQYPSHSEFMEIIDEREVDGVGFEIARFTDMVLKQVGNVIEELFSPLVLFDSGYLSRYRELTLDCLTKGIARHYHGFFSACLKKLRKRDPPEIKTALYAVRIALTGITVLTEGRVDAHLPTLNEKFGLDYVDDWIAMKVTEHEPVPDGLLDDVFSKLSKLKKELSRASHNSILPADPLRVDELHDLLVAVRLENFRSQGTGSEVQ